MNEQRKPTGINDGPSLAEQARRANERAQAAADIVIGIIGAAGLALVAYLIHTGG